MTTIQLRAKLVVDSDEPLATFIENSYLPWLREQNPTTAGSKDWWTREKIIRSMSKLLSIYLRRTAVFSDLTNEMIGAFLDWWKRMDPFMTDTPVKREVRKFMRYVTFVPDGRTTRSGRSPRSLSEAPETLWGICLKEYFPRRRKIRTEETKRQYRTAMADFCDFLGRDGVESDLNEDAIVMFAKHLEAKRLPPDGRLMSPATVNERTARLTALWNWLARRRRVHDFPELERVPVPRRNPKAWKPDELGRFFASCLLERGSVVEGITSADWFYSINSAIYDCGERIGAMLQARWEWYDPQTGLLELPAEVRKGNTADMLHPFHADTRAVLERMRQAGHELIWPCPFSRSTLYNRCKRICLRAGLPYVRWKSAFHKMRRTTATYLQMRGVDAGMVLGHSDQRVTRDSYLDRSQLVQQRVCDVLPRPQELIDGIPALPGQERPLPRLEYKPAPREPRREPEVEAMAFI